MRPLVCNALIAGRQAALQLRCPASSTTLSQRIPSLQSIQIRAATTYKAHAGYRTNPAAVPVNPNSANKIHPSKRPVKRPSVPPPSKNPQELAKLPYIVRRTPNSQLPIYPKYMSGGNRVLILIKKIDGDRRRLVEDLVQSLELERADIRLNPTTQHIEIKGSHFKKTQDWLLESGF